MKEIGARTGRFPLAKGWPGPTRFGKRRKKLMNRAMPTLLFLCAAVSILTMIGIIFTLFSESWAFFQKIPLREFFGSLKWNPLMEPKSFGIWPLVSGTLLITAIACLVAIPAGLAAAIYLSEYAPRALRQVIKPALEVLAGVPTIVYGYFALTFVTPLLRRVIPDLPVFNALSAGIAVGIMIIPMVSSLSEDAMRAVPKALRDASFALGATRLETALKVVLPAALSGIAAAFVLAFSRAIGETMIVTVAAGATPKLTANPLESIQTMTAYIVQVSLGDVSHGSVEYGSIFAVGLTLFVITLILNVAALKIARRFREEY